MYFRFLFFVILVIGCSTKDTTPIVTNLATPSKEGSGEPYLFTDQEGNIYLSWIEVKDSISSLLFSKWAGNSWTTPLKVAEGKDWFVNWADYPMLAAQGNNMLAHYLGKSGAGKFAYDVMVTQSNDGGVNWSAPASLNKDSLEAEHGFVSMVPYDSNYFVTWLDGRNTVMPGMENHDGHHGQMSVRAAVITMAGERLQEWELDNRTCDCCQTTAAITKNGPIVIYRDRSDEEIRDMSIVRWINGSWTTPKAIFNDHWKIAGCPVNGPRVDVIDNNLAVAWYTAPEGNAQVKIIFSTDGGETFSDPIRVDEGKTIGRVDVVMLDNNNAMVSWMEEGVIKAIKINRDGSKEKPITIASSSDARSSGFPQMTKSGNKLFFAWTDDQSKLIKSATIEIK